ncbi:MAG: radical SAM protein [Oscillospiraceae bacterium]|jgi:putative pyruvate formate lyase activating enzyme
MTGQGPCRLCPRECGADRDLRPGFCGAGSGIKAARAYLHKWEEPCIAGDKGAGTVFFSGCPLRCVFCQNGPISLGAFGAEITEDRLTEIFFELEEQGAACIDLVTPTPYAPDIAECIKKAKNRGIGIPFVWNSDGYEKPETLAMMDGLVDVYMPDFKYMSPDLAERYSGAADYPVIAKKALAEMVRQRGAPVFEDGLMKSGVIVRHLQLPGSLIDSKRVLRYLYLTYGDRIYISIMNQYTPCGDLTGYPELGRRLTRGEYGSLVDYAEELGITCGYTQEEGTAEESFIPQFDLTGVLKENGGR